MIQIIQIIQIPDSLFKKFKFSLHFILNLLSQLLSDRDIFYPHAKNDNRPPLLPHKAHITGFDLLGVIFRSADLIDAIHCIQSILTSHGDISENILRLHLAWLRLCYSGPIFCLLALQRLITVDDLFS